MFFNRYILLSIYPFVDNAIISILPRPLFTVSCFLLSERYTVPLTTGRVIAIILLMPSIITVITIYIIVLLLLSLVAYHITTPYTSGQRGRRLFFPFCRHYYNVATV